MCPSRDEMMTIGNHQEKKEDTEEKQNIAIIERMISSLKNTHKYKDDSVMNLKRRKILSEICFLHREKTTMRMKDIIWRDLFMLFLGA